MFPSINIVTEINEPSQNIGKVFKFDFETNKYVFQDGKLVEISKEDAVKQFVSWTLKTQIAKFKIYHSDYGIDKDTFIGQKKLPQGFINSELKRQIEEQLTKHALIDRITNFSYSKVNDTLVINFTIITTYNDNIIVSEVI